MTKKYSLEQLLKRRSQRTSLGLPEPSRQPMAAPVDTFAQPALRLPPDKQAAVQTWVGAMSQLNAGLSDVSEKLLKEMEVQKAFETGQGIRHGVLEYFIQKRGQASPSLVKESFPNTQNNEAIQSIEDPYDRAAVIGAIEEEATHRLGFPEQRRQALELLKARGHDVSLFPRQRAIFDSSFADGYAMDAGRFLDDNTARLVDPDSGATVRSLIAQHVGTMLNRPDATFDELLQLSPYMATALGNLAHQREPGAKRAQSREHRKRLEASILYNTKEYENTAINAIHANANGVGSNDAAKAFAEMFAYIESKTAHEGNPEQGVRLMRVKFQELYARFTSRAFVKTLNSRQDAEDILHALEDGYNATTKTGIKAPPPVLSDTTTDDQAAIPDPVGFLDSWDRPPRPKYSKNGQRITPLPPEQPVQPYSAQAGARRAGQLWAQVDEQAKTDMPRLVRWALQTRAKYRPDDPDTEDIDESQEEVYLEDVLRNHPNFEIGDWGADDFNPFIDVLIAKLDKNKAWEGKTFKDLSDLKKMEIRGAIREQIGGLARTLRQNQDETNKYKNTAQGQESEIHGQDILTRIPQIIADAVANSHPDPAASLLHWRNPEDGLSIHEMLNKEFSDGTPMIPPGTALDQAIRKALARAPAVGSRILATEDKINYLLQHLPEYQGARGTGEPDPEGNPFRGSVANTAFKEWGDARAEEYQGDLVKEVTRLVDLVTKDTSYRDSLYLAKSDAERQALEDKKVASVHKEIREFVASLHARGEAANQEEANLAETIKTDWKALNNEQGPTSSLSNTTAALKERFSPEALKSFTSLYFTLRGVNPTDDALIQSLTEQGHPLAVLDWLGMVDNQNFPGVSQEFMNSNNFRHVRRSLARLFGLTPENVFDPADVRQGYFPGDPESEKQELPVQLSKEFQDSGMQATRVSLFRTVAAYRKFLQANGNSLAGLHASLKASDQLGKLASGKEPTVEELWKIQTKLTLEASRLSTPLVAARQVVGQLREIGPDLYTWKEFWKVWKDMGKKGYEKIAWDNPLYPFLDSSFSQFMKTKYGDLFPQARGIAGFQKSVGREMEPRDPTEEVADDILNPQKYPKKPRKPRKIFGVEVP